MQALARRFDKLRVDAVLPDTGLAAPLADEYPLGIAPSAVENLGRDQLVVEHDVGALQRLQRAQRQQVGIARAGADEEHRAGLLLRIARGLDGAHERPFRLVPTPGERGNADRTIDHALPESPQRTRRMARAREMFAVATHQSRKIADARRQQRFDALAQAAREHRRGPAGADRDYDIAAIDHGRNEKGRQVGPVDHVDHDVAGAGARGDLLIDRAAGRRDHRHEFGEVGLQRIDKATSR